MKDIKNIAKGLLVLSFLAVAVIAAPAHAENGPINASSKSFLDARASLKADALIKLENSVGVVLGSNNTLRVLGAKVTSVSGSEISATAPFGNSSLNFVIKTDSETKLNGKAYPGNVILSELKSGDKISFAGTITSSSSSSITVDGDHVVSQAFNGKAEDKNSFQGEVKAVNTSDNYLTVALKNGRTVKVNVSSSTVITLDGVVKTLSSIDEGDEVRITGEANADGTVITASKISVETEESDHNDDGKGRDDNENNGNKGGFWNRIRSWFR